MTQLPQQFVARMAAQLGDELPAFLRAYEEPYLRGLRLNPLKSVTQEYLPEGLGDPIPWEPTGRYLSVASNAGAMVLHEAGAWYLQEPSAMLPAAVLNAQPGEYVLDLCAAPGGKSTQMGLNMRGQGLLVCNEPVMKRAQILSRNVERMGLPHAWVVSALPDQLAELWPAGFDAVLVDAPCSGEGMFRRHPETRAEWQPGTTAGCVKRQAEILDAAAEMVRPGGRMVYATCTLSPVENEDTVAAFCARHPDFTLAPFHLPGVDAPGGVFTCYPHRMRGEGQFAALLRRAGAEEAILPLAAPAPLNRVAASVYQDFAPSLPQARMLENRLYGDGVWPDTGRLPVLRRGLHLGEIKGKFFVPDHAWAVSVCPPEVPRVPLTEEDARRYLSGETMPAEGRGWALACYGGLPLGWGKISDGVMKNHYPKGLRR